MNEPQFRELSAARALHALSPADERAFRAALAAHPEWRSIVDEDLETAAGISVAETPPPPRIRAALLDAIERTPQRTPSGDADPGAADPEAVGSGALEPGLAEPGAAAAPRRRAAWYALAACAALLLALVIAFPVRSALTPADPVGQALERVDSAADARVFSADFGGDGRASVHWSASERRAVFVVEGLPAVADDRDFELWIVRGETPISLGVLPADDDRGAAALAPGFRDGDIVAVTVEERGGSPTGAPTTDPILAVATA